MGKKVLLLALMAVFFTFSFANESLKKAKDLIKEKSYNQAKQLLLQVIEADESNHDAFYHLAKLYFWENDLDEATDHAEKAVELANQIPDYHFLLGQIYGRDARDASVFRQPFLAKNCKDEFLKTIELDPKHLQGHIGLAEYMFHAPGIVGGDKEEAYKLAKKVISLNELEGENLISSYLTKEEKLDEAKPHIDRLIELDEIRGRLRLLNYFGAKKDTVEAENQFIRLEELIGENPDYFWFYNSYGYVLLRDKRIDEAIEKFKIQIKLVPERANAYDSLGEAYFTAGKYDEAKKQYEKALELNSNLESAEEKLEEIEEIMQNKN